MSHVVDLLKQIKHEILFCLRLYGSYFTVIKSYLYLWYWPWIILSILGNRKWANSYIDFCSNHISHTKWSNISFLHSFFFSSEIMFYPHTPVCSWPLTFVLHMDARYGSYLLARWQVVSGVPNRYHMTNHGAGLDILTQSRKRKSLIPMKTASTLPVYSNCYATKSNVGPGNLGLKETPD